VCTPIGFSKENGLQPNEARSGIAASGLLDRGLITPNLQGGKRVQSPPEAVQRLINDCSAATTHNIRRAEPEGIAAIEGWRLGVGSSRVTDQGTVMNLCRAISKIKNPPKAIAKMSAD
jgi:hypothetical protein